MRRGERSGLPVIVAVHSTKLGPAVGGCRLWTYDDWRDGLADALRLSEASRRASGSPTWPSPITVIRTPSSESPTVALIAS